MPSYRVHRAGVDHARQLIDRGLVDVDTPWSDDAPSAAEANDFIGRHDIDAYGEWHLAEDTDASEGTKGRWRFPYGDFTKLNRAALIHAKQRAAQNGHDAIAEAADELLGRLDG